MTITHIMSTEIDSVAPLATIRDAAQKMPHRNFGSLPVMDGTMVMGIITDPHLALRAVADSRMPLTSVAEVMSQTLVCCREYQDVVEVADLMAAHQVWRIPVVNEQDELVGLVSLGDSAIAARAHRMAAAALEGISQTPPHP